MSEYKTEDRREDTETMEPDDWKWEEDYPSPYSPYTALVLSSGGVLGISQLGALYELNGELDYIKTYYGCSVGAIIAFFLIVGLKPITILSYIKRHPIKEVPDLSQLSSKFGIFDWNDVIGVHIEGLLKKTVYNREITLSELYKVTGKELYLVTYNHTLSKLEYLSYKTHPTLKCIDAIHMSSNIPVVFHDFIYEGCRYLDGALGDSYPIAVAAENVKKVEKIEKIEKSGHVLGLNIKEEREGKEDNRGKGGKTIKTEGLLSFLKYLYTIPNIPLKILKEIRCKSGDNVTTIDLNCDFSEPFSFDLSGDSIEKLFKTGIDAVKQYRRR